MKRKLIALLGGLAVSGAILAAAASLQVNSSSLGAGGSTVTSCDTDGVDVSYGTVYDTARGEYVVRTVNAVNWDDACEGAMVQAVLTDPANGMLGQGTGGITSGTASIAVSPVSASALGNVDVIVQN